MIYTKNISTPLSTTKTSAVQTRIPIGPGILHRVRVGFPPGPETDLHVAIDWKGAQVFPSNRQEDFAWDDYVFDWAEFFEIPGPGYAFTVRTWNDDAANAHLCVVTFDILPRDVLLPPSREFPLLQRISQILTGRR